MRRKNCTRSRRPAPWLFHCAIALPCNPVRTGIQPRAYLPSPVGLGFLGLSYSGNAGGLLFDPSLPIENGHVDANLPALAVGGTLDIFGRTGQVLGVLPYVVADLSGNFRGVQAARHRSGLADSTLRFSVNLYGAPAMHRREFAKYRPKLIIGASLTATPPTGQYDPNVLINLGTNRWAVKPEIGIARFIGKWEFEGAFGAWIYGKNSLLRKYLPYTATSWQRSDTCRAPAAASNVVGFRFDVLQRAAAPPSEARSMLIMKETLASVPHTESLSGAGSRCASPISTESPRASEPTFDQFLLPIKSSGTRPNSPHSFDCAWRVRCMQVVPHNFPIDGHARPLQHLRRLAFVPFRFFQRFAKLIQFRIFR